MSILDLGVCNARNARIETGLRVFFAFSFFTVPRVKLPLLRPPLMAMLRPVS